MQPVSVKIVQSCLLGFMLLFVTSHGASVEPVTDKAPIPGTYVLKAEGEEALGLEGTVSFESVLEEWGNDTHDLLKLQLSNEVKEATHYLGFYIANPGRNPALTLGTHKINGNIKCFLSEFEGVFGFASINAFCEQPFFAKTGKLTIREAGSESLIGSIEIRLENSEGESVYIKGGFNALRKN